MPDLLIIALAIATTLFLIGSAFRLVRTVYAMAGDIREVRDEVRRLADRAGPAEMA